MVTATKTETEGQAKAAASDEARAASAHSRINIPLNLQNWKDLDEATQKDLLWFHQHLLDSNMGWKEAAQAVGYDQSTIFRWLKGTYEGSWNNVSKAVRAYKKIVEQRADIQENELVPNSITDLIGGGLDYALANNSITTIIGESRAGKSVGSLIWRLNNNHGTSVYVVAPPYGGTKMLLRRIAEAVGVNKNMSAPAMYEAISRSFSPFRILIVDEAHRLLPGDRRTNPTNLEILRDLHDTTGCAVALLATQRFDDELRKSHYQFEQVLGRIGMPIRLPRRIPQEDYLPIVKQYVPRPSTRLIAECDQIANSMGRLGILVETLKVASKIAARAKGSITEAHVFKAIALRRKMMGEVKFAKS